MKVIVREKKNTGEEVLNIQTEYIKLESALKLANLVSSGGEGKILILDSHVKVNGQICTMRGKKLREGDRFELNDRQFVIHECH